MIKEEWINNIIGATSGIKEVEVNPFLFQKILNKINQPEIAPVLSFRYKMNWAFAISFVILLNFSSMLFYKSLVQKKNQDINIDALSKEINPTTNFNY